MTFWVRTARAEDAAALAEVFFTAIHEGAAKHYTKAERMAWAPKRPDAAGFSERLAELDVVLAERDGEVIGFMGLAPQAYVDMAFVRPQALGQGVAGALSAVLENRARAAGHAEMTTHASLMARGFFERQGWSVTAPESVARNGQTLRRFAMRKGLKG